jgi:hypothetical protein
MDKDERESNRLAAQALMPMMIEAFHTGLREAGSLSRWLLATLVAINGAAAISMLPLKMATGAKLAGAGAFLVGILAALGAGLWSLYAFKRVSAAAGTMLSYWLTVADDGERLEALEATMKADMDEAVGSRATYFLGSASAAAFLLGCAVVGWGMLSHEGANGLGAAADVQNPPPKWLYPGLIGFHCNAESSCRRIVRNVCLECPLSTQTRCRPPFVEKSGALVEQSCAGDGLG